MFNANEGRYGVRRVQRFIHRDELIDKRPKEKISFLQRKCGKGCR